MTRGRPFIDGRPNKLIALCPDVCGVGWDFRMGGVSENASRNCLWNGMRFPVEGLGGKCDPEFVIGVGCGFPTGAQAEAASHSGREFWDTVLRGLWAANYMGLS